MATLPSSNLCPAILDKLVEAVRAGAGRDISDVLVFGYLVAWVFNVMK